jgi:hypothetical protein
MTSLDRRITFKDACFLLGVMALTGCGGGGSDQSASTPAPIVNDSPCVASSVVQPDASSMPKLSIPNENTSLASVSSALASLAADGQEVAPVCSAAPVAASQTGT